MHINKEVQFITKIIDEYLISLFQNKMGYQDKIFESINYSLFSGGKRLRPILLLQSFRMFCDDFYKAMPFASAVEMIHTYSLIHDDLPSMDDDDFRRGKPSSHRVFGEAIAILSGDGLLNLAFETMLNYMFKNTDTLEDYIRLTRAINEIANYSGLNGMIGGQVMDLLSNETVMDETKLEFMYKAKTAALIQASVVSGAILGGGNEEDIDNMRKFGLYFGLAYQIKDDISDLKKDRLMDKVTFLTYNTIDEAKNKMIDLAKQSICLLNHYKGNSRDFLEEFIKILLGINFRNN